MLVLTAAAAALAVALALVRLWPLRCDGCGGLVPRCAAVRLAPGWPVYCPGARLPGARPRLCQTCFRQLLASLPTQDEESRQAIGRLLTDPMAGDALRRAASRASSGAKTVRVPAQPPPAP